MQETQSRHWILADQNSLQLASRGRAFWNLLATAWECSARGRNESGRWLEVVLGEESRSDPVASRSDSKRLGSASVADDIQEAARQEIECSGGVAELFAEGPPGEGQRAESESLEQALDRLVAKGEKVDGTRSGTEAEAPSRFGSNDRVRQCRRERSRVRITQERATRSRSLNRGMRSERGCALRLLGRRE